jgi:hypothetical protein
MVMLCLAAAAQGGTVEYQASSTLDDAYATSSANTWNYSYTYAVPPNAGTLSFNRWSIRVPKGATVTAAKIIMYGRNTSAGAGVSLIRLVDSDNCPELKTTNPFTLPVSSGNVTWSVPVNTWTASVWMDSPDISSLVQSFIDRPGYDYGNAIGLRTEYVSGTSKTGTSWDLTPNNLGAKLQITYTGGEAVITMHLADPEVRLAQKVYCVLENVGATDTLEALLDNTVIYEKEAPLGDEEVFVADYTGLTAGQHTLVVRVRDASDNIRGTSSRTWTTLHDGEPTVGINENNAICVNGEPFFPVTAWVLGHSHFQDAFTVGINALCGENNWPVVYNVSTFQTYLNDAEDEGWMVFGPINRWDGFNSTTPALSDTTKMAAYINAAKSGYPSLLAWGWDDEPELGGDAKHFMTRSWTELGHSLDTNHPSYVNFTGYVFTSFPGGQDLMKKYSYLYDKDQYGKNCLVADILSIDYYCYEYATKWDYVCLEDAMLALDRLQQWNRNLAPTMSFLETTDLRAEGDPSLTYPWTPCPTPTELHNLIWLTVIHNAKGISWYHYQTATPAENIAVMEAFLEDITLLTPVVLGPEETDYDVTVSLAGSGRVDHLVRQYGTDLYVFAASTRTETETATFAVSFLEDGDIVQVYGESRSIEAEDGYFVDEFAGLAVHIYVLDTNPPPEPVDVEYQIAASNDDMDCNAWNSTLNGTYVNVPYSSDGRRAFFRWQLDIPAGSTINSAHLEIKSNAAYSSATTMRLQAVASDSCPALTTLPYAWSVTSACADWTPTTWASGTWYESPDLTDVIQEVIDRPGYAENNYLGLRVSYVSGAYRRCLTYDSATTDGAVLVINYTPPNE